LLLPFCPSALLPFCPSALLPQLTLFVIITKAVIDMFAQRDNLVDSLSCQIVAMSAVLDEYALRTLISREFETFFMKKPKSRFRFWFSLR